MCVCSLAFLLPCTLRGQVVFGFDDDDEEEEDENEDEDEDDAVSLLERSMKGLLRLVAR